MHAARRIHRVELPVGSVIPYAGAVDGAARAHLARRGWLPCDGSPVYQSEYPELFRALGRDYGYPQDRAGAPGVFCLPDYRGMFLRGLDPSGHFDPEVKKRTSANPDGTGNAGAAVGSRQEQAIQEHEHDYAIASLSPPVPPPPSQLGLFGTGGPPLMTGTASTSAITVKGGEPDITETRPVNVAVNFLIKCRSRERPWSSCEGDEAPDTAPSSS